VLDGVDIDLTYAISEIQDLQSGAQATNERLEGIEARLKEVVSALNDFAYHAPANPYSASHMLRARLGPQE
jgi:chaperonin cofactor prefoldin